MPKIAKIRLSVHALICGGIGYNVFWFEETYSACLHLFFVNIVGNIWRKKLPGRKFACINFCGCLLSSETFACTNFRAWLVPSETFAPTIFADACCLRKRSRIQTFVDALCLRKRSRVQPFVDALCLGTQQDNHFVDINFLHNFA